MLINRIVNRIMIQINGKVIFHKKSKKKMYILDKKTKIHISSIDLDMRLLYDYEN